jgi:probable HAF family extracellular repeat protein
MNSNIRRGGMLFLAAVAGCLVPATVYSLPQITMTDLGIPGHAYAINEVGQVAGQVDATDHAFVWTPGSGIQHLGSLGGASWAFDLNDLGQVAGTSYADDGLLHAFRWTPEGEEMEDLGILPWATWSQGYFINDLGQVAGESGEPRHVFLWTPSEGMEDLGTLGGQMSEIAGPSPGRGLNDAGQVAGASQLPSDVFSAFRWTDADAMEDLGNLGGLYSRAEGMNSSGHVTGWTRTDYEAIFHAFRWTPDLGMEDLGAFEGNTYTIGLAINDVGQVAGISYDSSSGNRHVLLWDENGAMEDIAGPPEPWNSSFIVRAYNDLGHVAATGYSGSTYSVFHGFLWTRDGDWQDLCPDSSRCDVRDCNDVGQCVGFVEVSENVWHPALWDVELVPQTPQEQIEALIEAVADLGGGLTGVLDAALSKLNDGNPNNDVAAIGQLTAFIHQIEAKEKNGDIALEEAAALIAAAQAIIDELLGA